MHDFKNFPGLKAETSTTAICFEDKLQVAVGRSENLIRASDPLHRFKARSSTA